MVTLATAESASTMSLRSLFHVHRDPDWRIVGIFRYDRCRCGAVRTSRATSNLMGPVAAGWPDVFDRHGQLLGSSGWCRMADVPPDPGADLPVPVEVALQDIAWPV